jgi:hypothetical protein
MLLRSDLVEEIETGLLSSFGILQLGWSVCMPNF